ncbi:MULTISPECIES: universal stress protein [Salimicrobium]|uniref:Universal stress protein n=3 Tax=Salimicrobium TaxID=351195 RepID=K2G6Y2_9BACI|nr:MULTISPECIES: universal stress protein [Salimicrobium]AKG04128.1 universal stress protein UspA [Salimicrobium jeotgali]EKE30953.1 UspA domain-containing protein [Salimicrobium jeotgali]MBM7697418.1 nucleotide-binding universal stress UspA family protein [Salimicrobium jeotgali]SDX58950.1 Nucleotide-binding universal stress protein, UspA family [Salimicrobium album]SIS49377.1 Nucleotide-binding universal stress protein, UspA family [Salimicrobium salexigens]
MTFEYKNIVVAVDGSETAEKAFHKAVDIANRNNATIILSHIVDTRAFATVEAYDRSLAMRAEKHAYEILEDYKKQAQDAGLDSIEIEIEYGSPKVKLTKEIAPKYNADLIICGATGLNAMERFFIGSVSEHITRTAKCDVLVVRDSAQADS